MTAAARPTLGIPASVTVQNEEGAARITPDGARSKENAPRRFSVPPQQTTQKPYFAVTAQKLPGRSYVPAS
jgi:hypothetical protein